MSKEEKKSAMEALTADEQNPVQNQEHAHKHVHEHAHEQDQEHVHEHNTAHEHDHEDEQEHPHLHHHDDDEEGGCCCGHNHDHPHHHDEDDEDDGCCCGHDHDHEHNHEHHHHHDHEEESAPAVCKTCGRSIEQCICGMGNGEKRKIYVIENLDCANCAAKMEQKIAKIDGITSASITFATKQLRITAKDPDAYLDQILKICRTIESEVEITEQPEGRKEESSEEKKEQKKELTLILAGAVLFAAGEILEHCPAVPAVVSVAVYVVAYLLLGAEILATAVKNIGKGQIFDENFLMSIATVGAVATGQFAEAVGVMLFYRIGEFFEDVAVEKSRSQIMKAVDLRPEVVNLMQGEETVVVDASKAKVGDLLLVRPGDRIPLDGVVVEGESRIDTSPITGEPVPVKVQKESKVTSGCVNTSGQLVIRVEKPLSESMVTRILNSVENAAASKPKIDRFITRFARVYTPAVVLIALGTAVIPSLITGNWHHWIYTALTFLVMSCPCAIVLSVPLAFFSGIGAASRKGILFKGGAAIEAMEHVRAVVMDKTGTITKGNFILQEVVPMAEGADQEQKKELLRICASCERHSTHPIAESIVSAARGAQITLENPQSLEEISGHGIKAVLAVGTVLCGNRKLMEQENVDLDKAGDAPVGAEVFVAVNGTLAGHLVIADTIKPDAAEAVRKLHRQHVQTAMLSGDAEGTAQAVAKETGIDEVYARLLPEDKLTKLGEIRSRLGAVMFVGDGINDAPVLAGADVGAAMGSGADAAIEAADVVFMTSSMEAVPQALSIARLTRGISMENVIFAIAVKTAVLILGLCGFASMWLAVFADTGVAMICILNSIRILYKKIS